MDIYEEKKRSEIMANIRSSNTTLEIEVQNLLSRYGVQYMTQVTRLPGKPDILLPDESMVIFVHGCFWHHHRDCPKGSIPKTNRKFWEVKILANVKRDERNINQLEEMGFSVLVIWECEIKKGITENKILNRIGINS